MNNFVASLSDVFLKEIVSRNGVYSLPTLSEQRRSVIEHVLNLIEQAL
jgi:hypothetical protein